MKFENILKKYLYGLIRTLRSACGTSTKNKHLFKCKRYMYDKKFPDIVHHNVKPGI